MHGEGQALARRWRGMRVVRRGTSPRPTEPRGYVPNTPNALSRDPVFLTADEGRYPTALPPTAHSHLSHA